ncbi:hypothetical protein AAG906_009754 [Vitis piasezkii]
MFSRFMVIVNEFEALGKTYTEVEKFMKILRSLPKKWETKVMAIQEAKDLTKLSLEELIGSLMTYEINLNNHQRVEENRKSITFMASINDDDEEESEIESGEDSMEEECTNEDVNMCFMTLEEHEDEVNSNSNYNKFRTNDYISSVIRQDDFQSGNHKDKSSQREIMKKKNTSKRSVFQDPSFIRSLFLKNPIHPPLGCFSHLSHGFEPQGCHRGRDCWQIGGLAASINSPYVRRGHLGECTIRLGYAPFLQAIAFRRVGSV